MNFLSKKLPVAIKCQTNTRLKGCMEQWGKTGSSCSVTIFLLLSHLHSSLPHSYIKVTSPTCHHIRCALHPIHSLCCYYPLLGSVDGEMENLLFEEEKKSAMLIAKQTHLAFKIPVTLVTFLFWRQTKLGKKSWDSSLPPESAYLLFSFPLLFPL